MNIVNTDSLLEQLLNDGNGSTLNFLTACTCPSYEFELANLIDYTMPYMNIVLVPPLKCGTNM